MFLRVHPWSLDFMRQAGRLRYVLPKWVLPMVDQSAIQLLMPLDEAVIIPSDWINSREWEWQGRRSPPFHVHFSGKSDKWKISKTLKEHRPDEAQLVEGASRMDTEWSDFWLEFSKRRHVTLA